MKKDLDPTAKRKLVLDRTTLQPLQADQLDVAVGGLSQVNTCLFNSCKTRISKCDAAV